MSPESAFANPPPRKTADGWWEAVWQTPKGDHIVVKCATYIATWDNMTRQIRIWRRENEGATT